MRHSQPTDERTAPPAPQYDAARAASWRQRAENLHDTFVKELVEAFDFCPWAKSARAARRTRIVALFQHELEHFHVETLQDPAHRAIEVWQLVVPDAQMSAMQWRAFVARLEQDLRKQGHPLPWALAAFHPEHPGRPQSIGGVIGMLRRSPLPAIQLVRLQVLERIRDKAAKQVAALPQENQRTLLRWLHESKQVEQHAHWLQQGEELMKEILQEQHRLRISS